MQNELPIPVLNYHHVHNGPDPSFRVTTAELRTQLESLLNAGYTPIDLTQMIHLTGKLDREGQPILVTFDDGYENFLLHAWPILQELRVPCTLFLLSDYLGSWNDWDDLKRSRHRHLSLDQVHSLQQSGISWGSHTRSHPVLTQLGSAELISEMCDSQRELEQSLGIPIQAIAYPGGHVNRRVCLTAERYYSLGFSTDHRAGAATGHPFRIPRFDPSFCRNLADFQVQFHNFIKNEPQNS
jgi:peptidoglycan/xylan/chitin deacetylase (PgdA/CDA1 family)